MTRHATTLAKRRAAAAAVLLAALLAGCAQEMAEQPYYRPLEGTEFYADHSSARHPLPGTVDRQYAPPDWPLAGGTTRPTRETMTRLIGPTGDAAVEPTLEQMRQIPYVEELPLPVTEELTARGRQLFAIHCTPCHGIRGAGDGEVVRRGFTAPASFQSRRLRDAPAGYFFDVIMHGLGPMADYAPHATADERWAIIAYIRWLQKEDRDGGT